MDIRAWAADQLAARLLAGPWTQAAIEEGIRAGLGSMHHRTRAALAVRVTAFGAAGYPPSHPALDAHLKGSDYFQPPPGRLAGAVLDPPRFAPAFAGLPVPALATVGELAGWSGLLPGQLDWLSDERRGRSRATHPRFQHYHYAFIGKGGGRTRLLEAPKPRLKALQRRILHEILDAVPMHRCAHGFARGRSCLSGAQVHAGETVVLTLDLAEFFPSIGLARVHGLFRRLGYPWAVARRLAGLCTTVTPGSILLRHADRLDPDREGVDLYRAPHLPQGAPASPACANLLAWTLDLRLHGLARANKASYTRYADDLAFSGGLGSGARLDRFRQAAASIIREEGFHINLAKTRIMPRSSRQRVTGIVVNQHSNVERARYDALKALLHNCVRTGPEEQNQVGLPDFQRRLEGRVTWVEQVNPARGAKLRRMFDRIRWQPED